MGDRRFDEAWERWDAAQNDGRSGVALLDSLSNRELIELLAADEAKARPYERNIIATALLTREARRGGSQAREGALVLSRGDWDLLSRTQSLVWSAHVKAAASRERVEATRTYLADVRRAGAPRRSA